MTEKLKKCPFCNEIAMTVYNTKFGHQVFCTNDDCFMNEIIMIGFDTEEDAITAWNTRAADEKPEPEKIIRLLESELQTVNKRIEVRQGPCFRDETMKTQLLEGKAQAFEKAIEIIRQVDENSEPTTEELIEFINDPDARQEQHEYAMYLLEKRRKDENRKLEDRND